MSKNTNIADLINYISVDGSGNVVLTTGGQVATQSYVTTAVSNLVNAAPSTLDTLNELAAALGNDANFATTVTNSIATKLPLSGGTLTGALTGTSATFTGFGINATPTSGGTNVSYGRFLNTGADFYIGVEGSTAGGFFTGSSAYAGVFYSGTTQEFIINGVRRLQITTSGAATFSSKISVRGGTDQGGYYMDYQSDAASRSFRVSSENLVFGDFVIQRSTTRTGTTYENLLYFDASRAATFSSSITATAATFNPNASSILTLTSAGTNASMVKAGSGDELYLGGNDTWQMRFNGGNILMDNGGNVSIGTSAIGYKLFVSTTGTGAFNLNSANSTVGAPMIDFYDTGRLQETVISSYDGGTVGTYIASYSNHPLMFGTNAGASPTAKMTIAPNGNVGIATVSPTSPLHIGVNTSGNYKLTHWGEPGFTANYGLILRGDSSDGVFKFYGLNNGSESGAPLFSMNRASANSAFGTSTTSTNSRLNVNGSVKINRSIYNWYQAGWQGNGTYWHMKTNMSAGLGGNIQYTMSLFKGYMYSYSDPSVREGSYGFHNWDGVIYNAASSGNLFITAYRSSDNFVVLVIPSGSGETGVTIDWHQAFGYPFVEAIVTNASLHGATTGRY